ncbi:MAG: N-acetylmuramoyl-L-alanine amidase [Clostridia bacterium]|nr:N-acetylmuramoyl-L-alanine amidase [Clostridia bacterium]
MPGKIKRKLLAELVIFTVLFAVVAAFLGYTGFVIGQSDFASAAVFDAGKTKRIIVDPGHGGEDGGATGINGRVEKELNLELSQKLEAFLRLLDFDVIMTRDSDVSLGEDAEKGKRKMTDLVKRLEIAENNPDSVFLSIHMNKFPQEVCKGLQIWYSPNDDGSRRLADIIKNTVQTDLQSGNTRENKKANSSIYLLDRMKNISVLVECGFISNTEECAQLCDSAYQQKLAVCIADAVLDFYNNVG